jgi:transposase-like protein
MRPLAPVSPESFNPSRRSSADAYSLIRILKVLYLGLQRIEKKWTLPIQDWKRALDHFVILFGDRVTL